MRELDGLSYAELADALDTSVPAIKSLLVRARVGLVEAGEARDAACVDIRADLARAHGRGVRASGRSRRHLRDCDGCREYRQALRGVAQGLAALVPARGPLATAGQAAGHRRAPSSGAAGRGGRRHGRRGGGATAATATATKVVAIVCCAAVVGGGAAEVRQHVHAARPRTMRRPRAHGRGARRRAVAPVKAPLARAIDPVRDSAAAGADGARPPHARHGRRRRRPPPPSATGRVAAPRRRPPVARAAPEEAQTGGTMAPDEGSMPDEAGSTGAAGAPDEPRRAGAGDAPPARRRPPSRPAADASAPAESDPAPAHRLTAAGSTPGARALSSRPAMDRYQATLEHEELLVRRGTRSGLYCIVAVHSTVRGPALGGCRMLRYGDSRAAAARRVAPVAGDDLQVRRRRAPAGRRQGRDHAARRAAARPRPHGGAARLRRHGRRGRGPLHHRRGRGHVGPRHDGHRARHRARLGPLARPRRIRRPQLRTRRSASRRPCWPRSSGPSGPRR